MDLNRQVNSLDEELKLLKNEIKQVLLEIQEYVLNVQNPFTGNLVFTTPDALVGDPPPTAQVVVQSGTAAPRPTPPSAPPPPPQAAPQQPGSQPEPNENPFAMPGRPPGTAFQANDHGEASLPPDAEPAPYPPQSNPAGPGSRPRPDAATQAKQGAMDLITIAGIAQWTDRVLKQLGRENMETLLEVSEQTGRIPSELKKTLLALIPLFDPDDDGVAVSAKDIVILLAQLDGLMGTGSPAEVRLLPFLLQDSPEGLPLIRP